MKSKICFCNGTVLKKDLTRFAPLMLITGLFLAMMGWSVSQIYSNLGDYSVDFEPVQAFLSIAMFLGFVSALCLFGYLTKKKECDAMHAFPVRRETYFFTHTLAALLQFVIPFGILYLFLPGSRGWWFQMLLTFCGWLFFYGLTVFAMMLAGRKLAAAMICYLLHDIVSSVFMVIDSLYIPQLPGLYLDSEMLFYLTPTAHMSTLEFANATLPQLLLPMGLYALGGVALLTVSLLFYRKRKMERAGDFLAEKWLEPVFAWGLGISVACFTVSVSFLADISVWIPLILGLAIGFFGARMLFARSIKVFNRTALTSFGALVGVIGASIFIVSMDPLGAVTKIPQPEQIESVTLSDSYSYAYSLYSYGGSCTTSDPEEVALLRTIHQELIQQEALPEFDAADLEYYTYDNQFYLTYTLTNGSQLKRTYLVEDEEHLDQIEQLLSQPEHLLGTASLEELLSSASDLYAYGLDGGMIHTRRNFFQVFLADCEAGNMYTCDYNEESAWTVTMTINLNGESQNLSIYVPYAAVDTIAWLEDYFH